MGKISKQGSGEVGVSSWHILSLWKEEVGATNLRPPAMGVLSVTVALALCGQQATAEFCSASPLQPSLGALEWNFPKLFNDWALLPKNIASGLTTRTCWQVWTTISAQ